MAREGEMALFLSSWGRRISRNNVYLTVIKAGAARGLARALPQTVGKITSLPTAAGRR